MITMASMMPPKLEDEQDLISPDIEEETSFLDLEFDRRDSSESLENLNSWDVFVEKIRENGDDTGESKSLRCALRVFKAIVCLLTFAIVLTTAVVSKGTLLFMTSVIDKSRNFKICRKDLDLDKDKTYVVKITSAERSGWIWCLLFVLLVPDIFTFFRSCRICIFKTYKKPKLKSFLVVLLTESLHTIGCLLLVFVVFPSMDVARAITLTNAVCIVPGCLAMISRFSKKNFNRIELVLDVLAIVFQVLGLVLWPMTLSKTSDSTWIIICIPVAAILVSCGWWENFTDSQSRFLRCLSDVKEDLVNSRYFVYIFISVFKIILTFLFFLLLSGENVKYLLLNFDEGFQSQPVTVYSSPTQQRNIPARVTPPPSQLLTIYSNHFIPVYVALIHAIASLLCYTCGKFTCKVGIQSFSYSLPVSLTVPVALSLMMGGCGVRTQDPCAFADISPYLFWECPKDRFMGDFIVKDYGWVWILWIISQAWIAIHIWSPNSKRLASTEKLFVNPMYCSVVIDQSLALNRRKEDEDSPKENQEHMLNTTRDPRYYEENCFPEALESPYISQSTPFIYACATMWHETGDEMELLLKSIFRMDEDQSARKISQFYLQVPDPDYYLLEIHIFFDDAFVICDENDDESVPNSFVKEFLEVIHVAASKVHETDIKLRPPTKYSTPYGGRLVWCLPGGNFLYVHLKNKELIRHKKRWSQVMYMYYLLGHRLMDLDKTVQEKTVMAENTYILALDGDIDFRPHAVQLLVDLMNRNKGLGAACGRIHPVGSGAMVYYQKFEYAIGHWLQKATEHMIGCVLCSPGCFSLFRAKALMDDNVAKTYTMESKEASHYIQFDQGEDRWLCTLLLQRGYRVEYSAASDAYTHCPESFAEFYTQRRRWAPSTMANIMDLLVHYKTTVTCNDNISMPYIAYQGLMMIGTILGPGTIFLMLVGAMVSAFQISNWQSLLSNLFPVIFFILICFLAKNDTQIMIAQIFSAAYALLMMAVLVGISLQLVEDGISSPSAIFLLSLTASFLISAIVHPQEFWCVAHGLLYFLSVPSMYLLLALYSLVNLNVVSWGTREVQTKKSRKQLAEEEILNVQAVTVQQAKKDTGLLSWFNNLSGKKPADYLEEDGSVTFGLANLFRCICCTYPKSNEQNLILTKIQGELEALGKQMHNVQRQIEGPATRSHAMRRRSSVHRLQGDTNLDAVAEGIEETQELPKEDEYDSPEPEPEDDGVSDAQSHASNQPDQNQYWLSDKAFKQGTVEYLDEQETEFWKELIKTYLYPLVDKPGEKEKIANQLRDLRNKVVFGFLMLNSMFILIVFLLQTQKDTLHIDWPLNYQANITYIPAFNEVVIKIVPLQLEPINLILAFFFMLILVIQFVAMLLHRFQTMSHILASTELKVCTRGLKNLSGEAEVNKNAVKYAHELQKLKVDEVETDANMDRQVARRPTIQLLEDRRQPKPKVKTLDVAFQRRYMSLSVDNSRTDTPVLGALRRFSKNPETLEALKRRASRHRLGSLSVTPNQSLTGSQISDFNQWQKEYGNPSDALRRKVSRHRLGFLPDTPSLSLTGSQRSAFKKLDKEFGTPSGSIRSGYLNSGFDDDGESTSGHRRIPFFPTPSGASSSGSTKVRFENEGPSIEDGTASMKRRLSRISEK